MPSSFEIDIKNTSGLRALDELIQKAKQFEELLSRISSSLEGGGTPGQIRELQAQFRQGVQQYQGIQGAIAAIQGSSSFISPAEVIQSANLAAGTGIRGGSRADTNAQLALTALGLGLPPGVVIPAIGSGATLTQAGGAMSAGQVVAGLLASSQIAAMGLYNFSGAGGNAFGGGGFGGGGGGGFGGGALVPAGGGGGGLVPAGYFTVGTNVLRSAFPSHPGTVRDVNTGFGDIPIQSTLFSTPFGRAAMIGALGSQATDAVSTYYNYQSARILQGGDDVMTRYGAAGRIGGSLIGGLLGGLTGNPYALAAGAIAGGSIGESYLRYMGAPEQARQNAQVAIAPYLGAAYGTGAGQQIDRFTRDSILGSTGLSPEARSSPSFYGTQLGGGVNMESVRVSRLQRITDITNQTLPQNSPFRATVENTAAAFGILASALSTGGIDPLGPGQDNTGVIAPFEGYGGTTSQQDLRRGQSRLMRSTGSMLGRALDAQVDFTLSIAKRLGEPYGFQETIGETYTRRLEKMFHKGVDDMTKNIAPIFATLPETGGNIGDILSRYGDQLTATYLRIQSEDLTLPDGITNEGLRRTSANVRTGSRLVHLASLQPLGSAAGSAIAYRGQMADWQTLPDYQNNPAWAQAYANFRSARFASYGQQDIGVQGASGFEPGFSMREVALQGQQQRQQFMPFAPGNIFGTSLAIIQNNMAQIGVIGARLQNQDLSEQERFSLFSQQQGLMTENARNVGLLSEGFENRLPGMAAGRPSFFGRYTSAQGTALNLAGLGSPIRAFGAAGGGQAAMQDAFVNAFNVPSMGTSGAYSTTAQLNTSNELLGRILSAIERNTGSDGKGASGRTSDVLSRIAGGLDQIATIERDLLKMIHPGKN